MAGLTKMPGVGAKVRLVNDHDWDVLNVGDIFTVVSEWPCGGGVRIKKSDASGFSTPVSNRYAGDFELVTEPQPDVHALLANIGRRLHEVESHNAQQAYEINELYRTVARMEAQ